MRLRSARRRARRVGRRGGRATANPAPASAPNPGHDAIPILGPNAITQPGPDPSASVCPASSGVDAIAENAPCPRAPAPPRPRATALLGRLDCVAVRLACWEARSARAGSKSETAQPHRTPVRHSGTRSRLGPRSIRRRGATSPARRGGREGRLRACTHARERPTAGTPDRTPPDPRPPLQEGGRDGGARPDGPA